MLFTREETDSEKLKVKKIVDNADLVFSQNYERWNNYLKNIIQVNTKWAKQREYQEIAVKSLQTLITNWKYANGHLFHDGLFPSSAINYFNGF